MLRADVDPRALDQAGWAVVFAKETDSQVREAMAPLLSWRREQAGKLYQEIEVLPGEGARGFLKRQGIAPGIADPEHLPFYTLLIGSPETLPFEFQYEISNSRAVGRLYFRTPEEYAVYAETLVASESSDRSAAESKKAYFIAPSHENDPASQLKLKHLIRPLVSRLAKALPDGSVDLLAGGRAGKAAIVNALTEMKAGFVFGAAHGYRLPAGHPEQEIYQGAWVCQDWPGPPEAVDRAHVLTREDLPSAVQSQVLLLLGADSAGTPKWDQFDSENPFTDRRSVARRPFVNDLAMHLLSRGALAVIGHVDRSWTTTFLQADGEPFQQNVIEDIVRQLLKGWPVGLAMRSMAERSMQLLFQFYETLRSADSSDALEIGQLWVAGIDARNYIILGDPAARIQT